MKRFAATPAMIWQLAAPYFRSEQRWSARLLLAVVISLELAIVAIHVLINHWNARFFNSLQDRDWGSFGHQLFHFCLLAAAFVVVAVHQQYFAQWLRIRWRQWMTQHFLEHWLSGATHYRMQLLGDVADNPDQRIAEDIQLFIDRALSLGTGLLGAIVSLASFVVILWTLSAWVRPNLFGLELAIPGYLVWAALLYATIGTLLTHLIGRALIKLNFDQQKFEADFRFNLVRVRESSEQIALLRGEGAEQVRLMDRFKAIVSNWHLIMSRQKVLTFITTTYTHASHVFPYLVVSPAYFAGKLALGGLTQTASAFGSVQSALSFFITAYQQLAEWRAVITRLSDFAAAIAASRENRVGARGIVLELERGERELRIDNLQVALPDGTPLVGPATIEVAPGEHALVTGPSGTGKSTLFRAIAGIWPFGSGTVTVPEGAALMVLPQRPYLPIGSLAAAVAYPARPEDFHAGQIRNVLVAAGLPALPARLDEVAHWGAILSPGEQQRLAIARALLHRPDYLFLDEASASLDEATEGRLYRLLHRHLPQTAIVSIGHRSTLHAFHPRHLTVAQGTICDSTIAFKTAS